mmetsp:Transcript_34401/g.92190  ORF Transcript_34401/g.92190 Transcript_34401/m.92190 type:complete len:367 (+) Transcript_34401:87-1187(+)
MPLSTLPRNIRPFSADVYALDVREEQLVQLVHFLLALRVGVPHPAQPALVGGQEHLVLRGRHADAHGCQLVTGRPVGEAVHHVRVRALVVVHLAVLRTPVLVAAVAVGTAVLAELPLEERKRLHVHEPAVPGAPDDVREAHARSPAVRRHLHDAARHRVGDKGAEEEVHQVGVPPPHVGVPVEEALNHAGVREVVVHSSELALHALEARVDGQPGAVHVVQDFGLHLFELLDGVFDLGVALLERLQLLESRRHGAADVTERLPVLREHEGERQVGVAQDERIGKRIHELEAVSPAHHKGSRLVGRGQATVGRAVVSLGLLHQRLDVQLFLVVPRHYVVQLLVREFLQLRVVLVCIAAGCERTGGVD